ncbi:MAG: hypothetical protein SVY53_10270 [Chloroflexota bacterium]|nr:hypothetical protein [Chloroflexota bacterium]
MVVLHYDANIRIRLDRSHGFIEYEWMGHVQNDQFRELLEEILDYCVEHRCNKVLSDVRKMQVIPKEAQRWVVADWLPRMMQHGVSTFAVVEPKTGITSTSPQTVHRDTPDHTEDNRDTSDDMTFAIFHDILEARDWISSFGKVLV